jgi:hypothetical protein
LANPEELLKSREDLPIEWLGPMSDHLARRERMKS